MLHDVDSLRALTVRASDGEIGSVEDVYFSDDTWTIRYLVVDTGGWIAGRRVLISPHAVQRLDEGRGELTLRLTREQVKASPGYDADEPISRQYETEYAQHYGYPFYWMGPDLWGAGAYPMPPGGPIGAPAEPPQALKARHERERAERDPHLRSAREVSGYAIEAKDGNIGHVETFLFDVVSWAITALVVDTRNWLPGKHVLVSPDWIDAITWAEKKARVSVTRARIEASTEYDPQLLESGKRQAETERIMHALRLGE